MKIQNQIDQWFKKLLLVIKKWFQQKKMGKKFFLPPATPPSKLWPFPKFLVKIRCTFFWIPDMDVIKYWVSWKVLPFWCRAFVEPVLKINLPDLIKGYFAHTGCPKNPKLPYFGAKMEIHRYDQNIWSPEMFFLYDVVDLSWLISKMDRQR